VNATEQRKARITSAFEIKRPGQTPVTVTPGECWTVHQSADVAIHLGPNIGEQVVHISQLQFQQILNNRQLVFLSW
jgi:hypothetical protein